MKLFGKLPFAIDVGRCAAAECGVDVVSHEEAVRTVRVLLIPATGREYEARRWLLLLSLLLLRRVVRARRHHRLVSSCNKTNLTSVTVNSIIANYQN